MNNDQITIRGARLHNLKNITLSIPKNRLVVFSGVSGSGKSTLGFDILLKEGWRQYMEALGMLPYGMARPPLDAIEGLCPTISLGQNVTNRNPRSTVGTTTDVFTYLRVLFARLGRRPCPACGGEIPPLGDPAADSAADEDAPAGSFACPRCGAAVSELSMGSFSFNKPAGACPTCTGLGSVQQVDVTRVVDFSRSLVDGAVSGWNAVQIGYYTPVLLAAAAHYGIMLDLTCPVGQWGAAQRDLLLFGVESAQFGQHFAAIKPPATVRKGRFEGLVTSLLRHYGEHLHAHAHDEDYHDRLEEYLTHAPCPDCGGTRLRRESLAVRVAGRNIAEVARLPLSELVDWLAGLPGAFGAEENRLAAPMLAELEARVARLVEVGAGYLSLERSAPSLSAGEAQRLRLAGMLGSELSGLLYVFDEPTVGLHQRDTRRLIGLLRRLRDQGNTVLVIEHDLEMMAAADYLVDFGPGAGKHGGQVVAAGAPEVVGRAPGSLTGDYLSGRAAVPVPQQRRVPSGQALILRGARCHNLQNISVRLPLGVLVAVTGASGSGKSTLIFDILARALTRGEEAPGEFDGLEGGESLERVVIIDQEYIGRVARSNVATYTGVFEAVRAAFAAGSGLPAGYFSFNLPGGRCERCQGSGTLAVEMHFLPDMEVTCPACGGRRFTREVLAVKFGGLDIAEVLDLTVEEAREHFDGVPAARSRLQLLCDVGLGYLRLGQPATTLSGGEAQRVKLARELGRRGGGRTLYLLDEPTTGLHPADVTRLLGVLQRLVDAGGSVIFVEHQLDLIQAADWVIDLGPEGGAAGGRLVAEGTPEDVARAGGSLTGAYLRERMGMR